MSLLDRIVLNIDWQYKHHRQQKPIIMDGGQEVKGVVSGGDKQYQAHAKCLATRARASALEYF